MAESHKIVSGKKVAEPILADVRARVGGLREGGWKPRLASLEIGHNPAAAIYIRNQRRVCDKVGIEFENREFPAEVTQREMWAAIRALNVDPRITGIILQRPVPPHLDLQTLQWAISPSKDVEGMNPANIGKVVYGDCELGPCTSLASVEMLRATGLTLKGLDVVVVGHSELVGKPIALFLLAELATVSICHHETRNLTHFTRQADAIFVAVGQPGLITGDMVKPGAAVIDIGINQVDEVLANGQNSRRTVGDVDFDSVSQVAGWITPVPGGVGPVTLSMLMRNTVIAVERQRQVYEQNLLN